VIALFLTVLAAQATAMPQPARLPPPGWTAAPFATPLEYARYVRLENDGSQSILIATRQVCDCQTLVLMATVTRAFSQISHDAAQLDRSTATVCGQPAEQLLATNFAAPANALRNSDIFAFRDGNALVTMTYTFRYAAPMADAAATLATLCPPNPV
jgi:hypothetical protein